MHLTNQELVKAITDYQADPKANGNKLGEILTLFATRLVWKYHFNLPIEDSIQEVVIVCLRLAAQIDPKQNPFNFLTTSAINHLLHSRRKENTRLRQMQKYRLNLPAHKT
jgi:DNA-directed RNA polymerase specialized sigma24 family protein